MLKPASIARGFTLIELLVVLALLSFLTALAVPAVSGWVANARVRAVAEATQNALRLAQAEAIRRSRSTGFALTSGTPGAGATPTSNGQRWWVQSLIRSSDASTEGLFLRSGTEAASMNVTVTGPALVCFNSFGQQITMKGAANGMNMTCTAPSKSSTLTTYIFSSAQTPKRLAVQLGLGGEVRLCDPDKTLSSTLTDGCRTSS
jgi:type IV fimbrial biogenesis protein FimT